MMGIGGRGSRTRGHGVTIVTEKDEVEFLLKRKVCHEFSGEAYGSDYLSLQKGDVVVSVPHDEADQSWIYGALVATPCSSVCAAIEALRYDEVCFGWFPAAWWQAASSEDDYDNNSFAANVSGSGVLFLREDARPVLLTPTFEVASSKEVIRALLLLMSWASESEPKCHVQTRDDILGPVAEAFCTMVQDSPQDQSAAIEVGAVEILRKLPSYRGPVSSTWLAARACSALANQNPPLQQLIIYAGLVRDICNGSVKYSEDRQALTHLLSALLEGGEQNGAILVIGGSRVSDGEKG